MKTYTLTHQAEVRVREIFRTTRERWGQAQATKYKANLLSRLDHLCSGAPPHGRPCDALVPHTIEAANLFYYLEGRHYIIFVDLPDKLEVIDFVYSGRDLEAILDEIQAGLLK